VCIGPPNVADPIVISDADASKTRGNPTMRAGVTVFARTFLLPACLAISLLIGWSGTAGARSMSVTVFEEILAGLASEGGLSEGKTTLNYMLKTQVCENTALREQVDSSVVNQIGCNESGLRASAKAAFLSPDQSGPSFPCRNARKATELMICRDTGLASLDLVLDEVYRNTRARLSGADRQQLIRDELRWLDERESCAQRREVMTCIVRSYKNRISALADY
jgi:uncharacterized protein YecT (DUF1311 family)